MVRDKKMCMEDWLNDTDRGKPVYLEKNPFHCHLVYHKSHIDFLGIKYMPLWKEAGD